MYNPQIETFLCVAESGSFNKAAEKLYISSPAVIKQINLLEENLDLQLFTRSHRGLALTKAGKSLYQDAKYILQYCKDSVIRARNAMQVSENVIRIGTSPMTPAQMLVDLWPKVQAYANEEAVGNAVIKCGVPRDELFITTKIWISNAGYERAKASIDESLKKLKSDYIDLLLIHQPFGNYYGTYRAMGEAYKAGKLRAIGVSNFYPDRLIDLCQFVETTPAVNQVETHVFQQQKAAHEYMKNTAYSMNHGVPLPREEKASSQIQR